MTALPPPPDPRSSADFATRILAELDQPQHRLKRVLHVTGTNGKGSTVALLESVLRHAGYRTGLTTSPHLHHPGERIRIGGRPLATEAMVRLIEDDVLPAARRVGIAPAVRDMTIYTCAALLEFARQDVDVAIVEVGMGGRHDASNVFAAPLATAITTVSPDHMGALGPTIADIAAAKAGILRPRVPIVTGTTGTAFDVIRARAAALDAPVIQAAPLPLLGPCPGGQRVRFDGDRLAGDYNLALHGDFQRLNAAVALHLLESVQADLPVTPAALRAGLWQVRWPGRLEPAEALGSRWLFDSAHNVEGAAALKAHLQVAYPGHAFGLIYGCRDHRPWERFAAVVHGVFEQVWATYPPVPRARGTAPAELAAGDWGAATTATEGYPEAIFQAWQWALAQNRPALVVVAGQVRLVGACREYLKIGT